jgi:thioredoxin-related protein
MGNAGPISNYVGGAPEFHCLGEGAESPSRGVGDLLPSRQWLARSRLARARSWGERSSAMVRFGRRGLFLSLICLVVSTGPMPAQPSTARTPWETNLYGSWTRAVKEDRPLVVYFCMSSCRYCEMIEREVFASPPFASLSGRAILVRVEEGKDDEHRNVAKMMKSLEIDRFPITVVLDAKKDQIEEVTRIVGYHPADKFIKGIADGLAKWEKSRKDSKPAPVAVSEPKKFIDSNVTRASETSTSAACSLADAAVAKALKDMNYNFRTEELPGGKGCNHIISLEQDGKPVSVYVAHLYGRTVWLGVPLVRVEENRATVPVLLRILEESWNVFPAQFNYDRASRQLFLSKPLDQQEMLNAEQFRTQLHHLMFLVKQKESLWSGLGTR